MDMPIYRMQLNECIVEMLAAVYCPHVLEAMEKHREWELHFNTLCSIISNLPTAERNRELSKQIKYLMEIRKYSDGIGDGVNIFGPEKEQLNKMISTLERLLDSPKSQNI